MHQACASTQPGSKRTATVLMLPGLPKVPMTAARMLCHTMPAWTWWWAVIILCNKPLKHQLQSC